MIKTNVVSKCYLNVVSKFYLIVFLQIWSLCAMAYISNVDKQNFSSTNIITKNAGFENGKATWTSSGSPTTYSVQSTTVGNSSLSLQYDPAADGDYVETQTYTVQGAFQSRNGVACIRYKGADSNLELNIIDGSSNELATQAFSASTGWSDLCVNFIFPSSGTVKLRLEAEGDAAEGYFDDAFIGDANRVNISQVSSAQMYGTIKWAETVDCVWTVSSTSYSSFSADSDCPAPTTSGKAEAPATKIPAIKFTNLPPGRYHAFAIGKFDGSDNASRAQSWFRFYDGSNQWNGENNMGIEVAGGTSASFFSNTISAWYEYETAQSNVEIELQCRTESGDINCRVNAYDHDVTMIVVRYPLDSETAFSPSESIVYSGVKITGDSGHDFSTTSASYTKNTDADVISGDKTHFGNASITSTAGDFGFKMSKVPAGKYYVYFNTNMVGLYNSSQTRCLWALSDDAGTSFHAITYVSVTSGDDRQSIGFSGGIIEYDSVQTDKEFTIYSYRHSGGGTCYTRANIKDIEIGLIPVNEGISQPQILNQVTSSSSGGVRLIGADLNCDSGSAITDQDGSAIDSIGNISSGVCAVTVASGVFSSTPQCSCDISGSTLDESSRADATSATNVNITGTKPSDGSALTSFDCELICKGAR